ncbi:hypothetical protein B0H19DRAFT_985414 [Mycena capillaripes]|nr:hypothetical protein B0H19DRAFT_985414 [Mycena capillaripes]
MDIDDTPTRVEDLWFSDGSLVIQAEQSLYRVYRAVLGARSTVFNDMQSFPQPEDGETIEGCPVVKLPDAAADVTCFLRAIFDSSYFETYPTKTDLSTVVSILRLSNKYGVDYLRRRALVHLSSGIPMTYLDFAYEDDDESSLSDVQDGWKWAAAILAIGVARETEALWILPRLFYAIARTSSDSIRKILTGFPYKAHFAQLSGDDQTLLLKSSLQISVATDDVLWFLHSPNPVPGCKGNCAKARLQALAKVQQIMRAEKDRANPLGICRRAGIWETLEKSCCQACYQFFKKAHKEAAQALWDKLPEICKLPPWEDLEKMKDQALGA